MAKGSKKNKERAAAQANKARRVEKRNAAAPQSAAATTTTTTTEAKPKKSLKKIRRQKDKKRAANAEKRLPNQIVAQNKALKADLKEAEKFNASFTIDGKDFGYRDPKNLNTYSSSRRSDNRSGPFDGTNSNAYELTNPLYQYSQGRVSDAARALGIGNVNSQKEVNQILNQIRNPQSSAQPLPQVSGSGNKKNSDKEKSVDHGRKTGQRKNLSRDEFRANKGIGSNNMEGGIDPLQTLKDSFAGQISGLNDSIAGYQQQFLDQQANYDQSLLDMRNTLSAQMNPQRRNPIFGIRTPGMGGVARNIRNSFGRGGSRIGGIRNTTLNLS